MKAITLPTRSRWTILGLVWLAAATLSSEMSADQVNEAASVVVAANRLPDSDTGAPFTVHVLDAEELAKAPQLQLDDILRAEVPGFSLFRRNGSRTANPTTQGVTLRNFGPSGAGRTLVLLDGIPLNDPFAGYVLWSQTPAASLESVLVQPGGGAGLFGNAALAGTIFLVSKPMDADTSYLEGSIGNHGTYEAAAGGTLARPPFALRLSTERFVTEGYPVIAPGQRGGVDTKASADTGVIDLTGEWRASDETSLRLNGRWFHEERGNGTPYTGNETTGEDGSLTFTRKLPDLGDLQLSVYGQNRKFSSTFSSVKPDRNSETPALNQYDVPADAVGGSLVWGMSAGAHRLTLGSDFRYVDGQTNEMFFWNGKAFTRLRRAGGEELFEGVFLQDTWTVSDKAIVVGGLRWDHWDLLNGFRKETDIATGHIRTDSHFPDRNDQEINGRLGLRYNLCDGLMARAAGYSGFRVPTLNELYRPFRVGNDVTEANPALNPEHLLGGEVSLEWQASRTFSISGTGFVNQMEDAISNVTIGIGPGTFNPGGFIPAGGVLRQRQNIDLVVAPGFEGTATWELYKDLQFKGSYLFTHPAIERAADPKLRGNLLAQTPEHVVTLGLEWHPLARWMFIGQMRYCARQFEDDQNSRVLAPCTTVDTAVSYQFSRHASAALRVENLLDQEIETGVSADNIRSIGAPRLVTLTVRWQL